MAQIWCNGKTSCTLSSNWGTDPCSGTYKVSTVSYTCSPGMPPTAMPPALPSTAAQGSKHRLRLPLLLENFAFTATDAGVCSRAVSSVSYCDGYNTSISCPAGQVLSIQAAFFGRNDSTTCVAEGVASKLTPAAWSNTNCSFAGALRVAQGLCNDRTSCALNDTWGTEPCAGTYKFSMLSYTCAPGAQCLPVWTSSDMAREDLLSVRTLHLSFESFTATHSRCILCKGASFPPPLPPASPPPAPPPVNIYLGESMS